MYEYFDHTADIGLRIESPTLEGLFADAARGLAELLCPETEKIRPALERTISLKSDTLAYLLFDFLAEILFLFEQDRFLVSALEVEIEGNERLAARLFGEKMNPARHPMGMEVKAVTYHGLEVQRTGSGFSATVILDI